MNTPADTWVYFVAGYAVILASLAGYIFSLVFRWKKLKDRLQKLPGLKRSAAGHSKQPGN